MVDVWTCASVQEGEPRGSRAATGIHNDCCSLVCNGKHIDIHEWAVVATIVAPCEFPWPMPRAKQPRFLKHVGG